MCVVAGVSAVAVRPSGAVRGCWETREGLDSLRAHRLGQYTLIKAPARPEAGWGRALP